MASDRDMWRTAMRKGEAEFEKSTNNQDGKQTTKKENAPLHRPDLPCSYCDRSCHSAIGRDEKSHLCMLS
jgi:formamidopyrimidine-DNA glycosylase